MSAKRPTTFEPAYHFERLDRDQLKTDAERALRISELIWQAAPDFYSLFPCAKDALLFAIAGTIGASDYELANTLVVRDSLREVALVAGTSMQSRSQAQLASVMLLVRNVQADARADCVRRVRDYASHMEPIEAEGHYVARVSVDPECRGEGLGRKIFGQYLQRLAPQPVHLHVHGNNTAAIALYRSLGFKRRSTTSYQFPAFTRV